MKTISVAALRQNPTQALNEVEQGATYVVTRHDREIGRLVPPQRPTVISPDAFHSILRATPLRTDWAGELAEVRGDVDGEDPWSART